MVQPHNQVRTGISYGSLAEGLVPEFELREAAIFSGYTWKEWQALDYNERVYGVAYFRLRKVVEMHQEDAVQSTIERKAKAPRR